MATVQTRRSISVRGATYDSLRVYCDQHQRSMSDVVEELLGKLLGTTTSAATELPAVSAKRAPRPAPVLANKVVRAPEPRPVAPPPPKPEAKIEAKIEPKVAREGRPAPTPAQKVIPERVQAPKNDYRNIQF